MVTRAAPPSPAGSKLEQIISALRRPQGATIADLAVLTGWQEKSVRGAISGALKTKRQLNVVSSKGGAVRTYHIEEAREFARRPLGGE